MKNFITSKINSRFWLVMLLFAFIFNAPLAKAQLLTCNAHFVHQTVQPQNGVYFSPSTNPAGATYYWSFGDGVTATNSNPVHSYAPGNYQACLTVTVPASPNTLACTATFCDSIHIASTTVNCNAAFTMQSGTAPYSIHFINSANATGATYSWTFGDGGTSTNADPTHTYAPGNYQVCLTVTVPGTNGGVACTATHCDSVHVTPVIVNCSAHFTSQISPSNPNGVYFIGATNNPTGTVYSWTFGDGGTGSGVNTYHLYAAGNYQVCLTVTVPGSPNTIACTSTFCDSIHIAPTTVNCNAAFTMQPGTVQNSIQFINSPNATGATYSWTFGDGGTSTNADPIHTYAPGNYQACLTVTVPGVNGTVACTATHCDSVHITQTTVNCNAVFTHQHSPSNNLSEYFTGPINPTGTLYTWHFGDGTSGSGINTVHTYAPGHYKACLTVTVPGLNGTVLCTATFCDSVHITQNTVTCNAHFTHQASTSGNNAVYFVAATNPTGTIYNWHFGDGTTGTGANIVHNYAPGNYQVCLTVTVPGTNGALSCTSTFCDSIHVVQTITCNAHFTTQSASAVNSLYFISSPNPAGTQYLWSFGDGGTATTANAVHNFAPGNYQVCLTVKVFATGSNVILCTSTFCDSVHFVNTAYCTADFSFIKVANAVRTYSFTNLSSANSTSYFWHFGDASTSTLVNPVHQYATIGTRQVCLTMFDNVHQCSNTKCKVINVANAAPISAARNIETNDEGLTVNIYPNPIANNAIIHIENAKSPVTFMMYDNTGKTTEKIIQLGNGDHELNSDKYAAGIYFYRVISDDAKGSSGKLIIQK